MSEYGHVGEEQVLRSPKGAAFFRTGIVSGQDVPRGLVKVTFPDRDNMESDWLQVLFSRTHFDQAYDLPDINELVACFMDSLDEDGIVLGAAYSDVDKPPSEVTADVNYRRYKDGTVIFYDRAGHVLKATFPDGAELSYDASSHALLATLPGGSVTVDNPGGTVQVNCDSATVDCDSATIDAASSVDVTTGTATVNADAVNLNALVTVT